ncbi:MAG: hypothetical protein WCD57_10515, partial [Acidobacteriaceae bacterium]
HMQSTEATTLNRKSGEAEGSAVSPSLTAEAEEENCRSLDFAPNDKGEGCCWTESITEEKVVDQDAGGPSQSLTITPHPFI